MHGASGIIVELHWRLTNNPRLLPPEAARSRQKIVLGDFAGVTLGPDDLLLYLSVRGAKHHWFRLKWLADVHALLARCDAGALAAFSNARPIWASPRLPGRPC